LEISFIRSSFLGSLDTCELKTFIIYSLGLPDDPNIKTIIGTICHKVMEVLALMKKEYQRTGNKVIEVEDDTLGKFIVHWDDLMSEDWLTEEEIIKINSTRKNKSTYGPNAPPSGPDGKSNEYKDQIQLTYPHCQYGREIVNEITRMSFEHYKERNPQFEWQAVNLKDAYNYVWIVLDHHQGTFDPRKREIFGTEQKFELVIDAPWASYEYENNGDPLCGQLKLKGTIDLIYKVDEDTLEVNDYKFGQRVNWANGEIKTLEKLGKDHQLMLYYYVLRKLFPQYKNIILSIFFARDGGPFSVCFEDHHIDSMEDYLRQRFEYIKNLKEPKMRDPEQKDFLCYRLCPFYKEKVGDTNFCKHIHDSIKSAGMENVINLYRKKDFNIDYYQAPGE
jgi:hypothetical protein